MSRHNRQRNKRQANRLWHVFQEMSQKKPGALGFQLSLVDLILYRLDNTGRFPGYVTPEQREAYKRYA